jgi:hypothetical protein
MVRAAPPVSLQSANFYFTGPNISTLSSAAHADQGLGNTVASSIKEA